MYCIRSCLYFSPDQICSRPSAFNLQPQQKNTEVYSALEVQCDRVPIWPHCPSDFLSVYFLFRFGFLKRRQKKVVFIFEFETREIFMSWETIFSLSGATFIVSCGDCCGVSSLMTTKSHKHHLPLNGTCVKF